MRKNLSILIVVLVCLFVSVSVMAQGSILMKGYHFESLQNAKIPAGLAKQGYEPGVRGHYIVQFDGPILQEWRTEVEKMGVSIEEYIPEFAYLVSMPGKAKAKVQKLPYIADIIVFQPAFKLSPELVDIFGVKKIKDGRAEGVFMVQTFDKNLADLETLVKNGRGKVLATGKNLVKVQLNRAYLANLAQHDNVKYIEEVPVYQLFNDVAKSYVDADDLWNLGYDGTGQIVAVCDTGLDSGVNDSSMHLDFQGRILAIYALGRNNDASDTHGHGTHVSGSVLGDGASSNGQIKGMAPNAQLVFQSVLDSSGGLGGLPNDLNDLFAQAYADGARIHTNSWGASVYGDYTSDSANVDEFTNQYRDMIVLFAASNDGPSTDSIGAPGTAKNCITVGASENYRPEKGSYADDPTDIASFSSRGWTSDGRYKPDIVAPGTYILSTRSSLAADSAFWANYDANYAFMGGTSMATPITAGTVATARDYMMTAWSHTPSSSFMKAILINGATDLGYSFPSRDQGWGRVSLTNSLTARELEWVDEAQDLTTGSSMVYTYTLESSNTPLKVTLVWTDVAASTSASIALVNDLDLKVTSPDGTVYYGNDFASPFNSGFDRLNNVENVFVDFPMTGTWTVEVLGYNIPTGPQNYSLVTGADFGTPIYDPTPPTVSLTAPTAGATVSNTVTLAADASDNIGIARVDFYADGIYIGQDLDSPYTYDWDSTSVPNGSHSLTAKAFDTVGNNTVSAPVTVTTDNVITEQTDTFTGYVDYYGTKSQYHTIDVSRTGTINLDLTWDTSSDLDMFLYDPSGTEVARAYTVSKPETITYEATTTGLYEIKVDAYSGDGNYTLTANYPVNGDGGTTPPPGPTETLDTTGTLDKSTTSLDFTVTVGDTVGSIDVDLSWPTARYDLDVYILDPNGNEVASATTGNNPETLSYSPIQTTGTYTIRVQTASKLNKAEIFNLLVTYPI